MGGKARSSKKAVSSSQRITNPLVRAKIDMLWQFEKDCRMLASTKDVPEVLKAYDAARRIAQLNDRNLEQAYEELRILLSDYPLAERCLSHGLLDAPDTYENLPKIGRYTNHVKTTKKQIRASVLADYTSDPCGYEQLLDRASLRPLPVQMQRMVELVRKYQSLP